MNPVKKVYRLKQTTQNPNPDRRTKDVAWAVPEWKEGQLFAELVNPVLGTNLAYDGDGFWRETTNA